MDWGRTGVHLGTFGYTKVVLESSSVIGYMVPLDLSFDQETRAEASKLYFPKLVVVVNPCLELIGSELAKHHFGIACNHESHRYTVLVVQLAWETSLILEVQALLAGQPLEVGSSAPDQGTYLVVGGSHSYLGLQVW